MRGRCGAGIELTSKQVLGGDVQPALICKWLDPPRKGEMTKLIVVLLCCSFISQSLTMITENNYNNER